MNDTQLREQAILNRVYDDEAKALRINASALDAQYVNVAGDTMIGPNSTTFFQIQQADTTVVFNVDTTNKRVGIGTATPQAGFHYQGDILYLTPVAGAESNDNITIKNYATGNGAPDIILRTADIDGAYGIGVGTLSLIGGSKTTHYGGIGGGGGKISLQGGRGRDAGNDPSSYAPILLQSNGGNVGIGTTEPGRNVEIYGTSSILRLRDSGATANATLAYIEFGGTNDAVWSRTGYIGDTSSGNADIVVRAEVGDLHLGDSSGGTVMNLQSGNVGIGETTPLARLHVKGSANDQQLIVQAHSTQNANILEIQESGTTVMHSISGTGAALFQNFTDSTTGFQILDKDGGTSIFNVDTVNKRVGIGTVTPTAPLTFVFANEDKIHFAGNAISGIGVAGGNIVCWAGADGYWAFADGSRSSTHIAVFDFANRRFGIGVTGFALPTALFEARGKADEIQTLIKANSTQTSNILEIQDSNSALLLSISGEGDLLFEGANSGLAFGEVFKVGNSVETAISISGKANKVQYLFFDTDGPSNNTTPAHAQDHITITKAGIYYVSVCIHADSVVGPGAGFGFSVYKNDGQTEIVNLHSHRDYSGGGGEAGSANVCGLADLSVDDTIELWVWNEGGTENIIIADAGISVTQIGGT